jgi:hypothetical protein
VSSRVRWFVFALFIVILTTVFVVIPMFKAAIVRADRASLEAVARRFPNYTVEQRTAILRELQSQRHPSTRDMSLSAWMKRIRAFTGTSSMATPAAANFTGNLTTVSVPSADLMELAQQSDCSLTLRDAPYSLLSGPMFSYTLASSTAGYGAVLHTAAGLTTTAGQFPSGCGNTNVGVTSRKIVFPGVTTSGVRVYAVHFFNATVNQEQVYSVVAKSDDTFQSFNTLSNPSTNNVVDLATSDLNGDGNGDLVAINGPVSGSGSATVTVFLGNADGSFPAPTEITLAGSTAISTVIDDFNGDGKKDIVVATASGPVGPGATYYINFLAGKGDGTFQAVQSHTETPSTNSGNNPYFGLISADLRSSGHKDLITSAGVVLLGNGDGTFSQSSTAAFPVSTATSQWGPNVVAGDFNNDKVLDLAVDNGESVQIYLGKGDGTFTFNTSYSTIGNVGYLVAQDIDGDGNVDLYSGAGNNGSLGGDQFDFNMGYALMGNGDGTFRCAPFEGFFYTGTNLADLNGDKLLDAVGVNSNESFTSYIGDGKGNFTAGATLVVSPIMINGTQYTLNGIDSYSVADINGDGFADLVYLGSNFYGPNFAPGIFVALGKGDGSFSAPTFVAVPAFVQQPDTDINPTITGIRLADINHDGKQDVVYIYTTTSLKTNTSYLGIAVQLGGGDGTFSKTSELTQLYSGSTLPNPGAYQLALIADINKDSNPDLFVLSGLSGNAPSFTLQTLLGKGDGTFNAPTTVSGVTPAGTLYGTESAPITLADMNNDGSLDIVALADDATTQDLDIVIALGNGDGTFQSPKVTSYSGQYLNGTGLAVGDFDGDGNLDVATLSFLGPQESGIAYGNGDGTLRTGGSSSSVMPAQGFYIGTGGASIALDLNGDGKADILSGSVEFLNQGAASGGGGGGSPDFGMSLAQPTVSATYGTAVTVTDALSITSSNGFNQAVTLTCSGAPQYSSCSVSPSSVTPSGTTSGSATVSIQTNQSSAAMFRTGKPGGMVLAGLTGCTLFVFVFFGARGVRRPLRRLSLAFGLAVCWGLIACGGSSYGGGSNGNGNGNSTQNTPKGSYTITVNATSGSLSHSATLTFTVQ